MAILEDGAFFGEGCLSGQLLRLATATAMSETSVVRITKTEMVRVLHSEPTFAEMFTAHLLIRNSRVEEDPMGVYEDNFGFWDIDGPEEREFFEDTQRKSVLIACKRCKCAVRLIPPKTVCASCVSALECGAPASMEEYGSQEPLLDSARPS